MSKENHAFAIIAVKYDQNRFLVAKLFCIMV